MTTTTVYQRQFWAGQATTDLEIARGWCAYGNWEKAIEALYAAMRHSEMAGDIVRVIRCAVAISACRDVLAAAAPTPAEPDWHAWPQQMAA